MLYLPPGQPPEKAPEQVAESKGNNYVLNCLAEGQH
jgi:hypothetical protein